MELSCGVRSRRHRCCCMCTLVLQCQRCLTQRPRTLERLPCHEGKRREGRVRQREKGGERAAVAGTRSRPVHTGTRRKSNASRHGAPRDQHTRLDTPSVCCRVLQRVAVCCSVFLTWLACSTECCRVLQSVSECCSVLQWCSYHGAQPVAPSLPAGGHFLCMIRRRRA